MTVTDRLREAIEKYGTPLADNRVVLNLDDVPRIAYRAGIEAALAVQPVPTDAEIERTLWDLEHAAAMSNTTDKREAAKWGERKTRHSETLLRLIAAQRSAAQREALEAVREWSKHTMAQLTLRRDDHVYENVIRHIDAMLAKEDGDE